MPEQTRNLISRATLALVGTAFLYAGYICEAKAVELYRDEQQRLARLPAPSPGAFSRRRMNGGFLLIGAIGAAALLGGVTCAAASIIPWSWWEALLRRNPPITHDFPEEGWRPHL